MIVGEGRNENGPQTEFVADRETHLKTRHRHPLMVLCAHNYTSESCDMELAYVVSSHMLKTRRQCINSLQIRQGMNNDAIASLMLHN